MQRSLLHRLLLLAALLVAALPLVAAPVCVDGVCYPSEEAARAAGVRLPVLSEGASAHDADGRRLAMGYMSVPEMLAFLRDEPPPEGRLEDHALWIVLLLVLAGGLRPISRHACCRLCL